jgi:hypothetical protein
MMGKVRRILFFKMEIMEGRVIMGMGLEVLGLDFNLICKIVRLLCKKRHLIIPVLSI